MPEATTRTLNHFAFFKFQNHYYSQPKETRRRFRESFLSKLQGIAKQTDIYQVYPAETDTDFLVWSSIEANEPHIAREFFTAFAEATVSQRMFIEPVKTLWGFTKPSQYTKTRSTQEIDPFAVERKNYLIVYPFTKTIDWYLLRREARQGMMNEHIKVGKQYPDIKQLLLYSFGLQNQEFVVVYETDNLTQFSDLVYELRDTDARLYTERDTPLVTAIYHPAEETLALWD